MTQPTFEQALQNALSRMPSRIVIQPHLLYPGSLLRQIHKRVTELSRCHPHIEWIQVDALGPDASLVECVLDLAFDATDRDFRRELLVERGNNPH
jgi:sirohydrochlorin ferrochelatase